MPEEVKSIQISGGSPKDLIRRRRRSKRRQEGGGDEDAPLSSASGQVPIISKLGTEPAPDIKMPNPAPAASPAYHIIPKGDPWIQKGGSAAPAAPVAAIPKSNSPPGPQIGGVILKSKQKTAKVLLKKKEAPVAAPTVPSGKPKRSATRKVILKSLGKRLKKTRHAVKNASTLPLEKVRAALVEKKLIKPTSKAPESVLRQIYADSLIVAKKTL